MSNFPSPTCLFLTNFLRSPGFNIYMFPRFSQHLLACILSQYLNSPHPLPAFIFGSQKFPLRLSDFFACIFMYLHFVSMSRPRLHPSSLNNFLRSSCFNIELSLFSYVPVNFLRPFRFIHRLPPLASPPLLTILLFQCWNFPGRHQQLLACIWSQYLNSPHPVPGPKNVYEFQKRRRQGPKTSSPM